MRVVAGELRGRRLASAGDRETRPTSERVRSALFDWLGDAVVGARVLDLFAGSGSLGIEALSRGAGEAVFVERARGALAALRRNLEQLGLEDVGHCLAGDVRKVLARGAPAHGVFDLVLADPPYAGDWGERLVAERGAGALLAAGGWLVVERSSARERPPRLFGLRFCEERRYGGTAFDAYLRAPEAG